jgi:hypothetical protein
MNQGLPDRRRPENGLDSTDFCLGCEMTNHKLFEREVVPQYLKLAKKAAAEARFVINQIGYNSRKHDELLRYIRYAKLPLSEAVSPEEAMTPARVREIHSEQLTKLEADRGKRFWALHRG